MTRNQPKSCYRLYVGHGNWINLSPKTTHDLQEIFTKGLPCRYLLTDNLYIDIIPNDVDCNSKNIDLIGLMRADLVYKIHTTEHEVQQKLSHYIYDLLHEQGIMDAFPPVRPNEDLPLVTSLPNHRHLSLVPIVVGAVRRGPIAGSYKRKLLPSSDQHNKRSSSSSSRSKKKFLPKKVAKKPNMSNSILLTDMRRKKNTSLMIHTPTSVVSPSSPFSGIEDEYFKSENSFHESEPVAVHPPNDMYQGQFTPSQHIWSLPYRNPPFNFTYPPAASMDFDDLYQYNPPSYSHEIHNPAIEEHQLYHTNNLLEHEKPLPSELDKERTGMSSSESSVLAMSSPHYFSCMQPSKSLLEEQSISQHESKQYKPTLTTTPSQGI